MSTLKPISAPLDRASELRSDEAALDRLWNSAKIIRVSNSQLATDGKSLLFLSATEVEELIASKVFTSGDKYFLGIDTASKVAYFAWDCDEVGLSAGETSTEGLASLRELGGTLDEFELGISMQATALSNWHRSHPHCSKCGAETKSTLGGSVRACVKDQSQHHPRTDSAVIVLVKDKDDRILLGHQPIWPDGRFSTFAGFLEPGETFEQCVEREVFEESGVKVNEIKYLGSQPWPFPASIMIAFSAVVDDPSTAKADGVEITEVRWFSRAELKSSVADGSLLLPPTISVARKMIAMWFGPGAEKLTGGESWR
ncbi:NAD+ diphosphatase [Candidatus Planktophila limnetica]|uniref:NAD(+) diphosphatase n=1 Tax=Candidatus Planktophila limnetica TaxID=573600 RepID=A0A249LH31_9ACTN|nr:NAD(+) diphosphatase [Candidatus Planktophila limnetica]ASY28185.1 NAD+ diphosphatase [Candidatus Planktophila limnetica]